MWTPTQSYRDIGSASWAGDLQCLSRLPPQDRLRRAAHQKKKKKKKQNGQKQTSSSTNSINTTIHFHSHQIASSCMPTPLAPIKPQARLPGQRKNKRRLQYSPDGFTGTPTSGMHKRRGSSLFGLWALRTLYAVGRAGVDAFQWRGVGGVGTGGRGGTRGQLQQHHHHHYHRGEACVSLPPWRVLHWIRRHVGRDVQLRYMPICTQRQRKHTPLLCSSCLS